MIHVRNVLGTKDRVHFALEKLKLFAFMLSARIDRIILNKQCISSANIES